MKIYLAGSSLEMTRAETWRAKLLEHGFEVTSTWIENIRRVGAANPRDVPSEDRAEYAVNCLREVVRSDALWFLVPPINVQTRGAWGELVAAWMSPTMFHIISSGDVLQSIFCALGNEFADDEDAFAYLLEMKNG